MGFYEILQIAIILLGPIPLQMYLKDTKVGRILSPIVVAYAIGIGISTFKLMPLSESISDWGVKISIMLAIPLLLFGADIIGWLKHSRSTVLSFFYAIIAAFVSCVLYGLIFKNHIDGVEEYSGMLTGVYTGGTATMNAVAIGLDVTPKVFAFVNSIEMFVGGIYLLFLTSVAPMFFGSFLKKYVPAEGEVDDYEEEGFSWKNLPSMSAAFGLSVVIIGITLGTVIGVYGNMDKPTMIIIILTTLSIGASFIPKVGKLKGSFDVAEYLLLVFSIAAGMLCDFGIVINEGGLMLLYTALSWLTVVFIHTLLSWLSKIDRDTTMITSTAALYGPAFIGQIATILGNKRIIIAGIATGIMGYAVGNYLGLFVTYLLRSM